MPNLFYDKNEEIPKFKSINYYSNIFSEYNKFFPSLEKALEQMILSTGIKYEKSIKLVKEILDNTENIVEFNFNLIREKYPILNREEAKIISSYSYEASDSNYSPYKILNRNLNDENRERGLKNISKYLFIFLKTLRKLDRYYPKQKYMYRCINKHVNLKKDYFNEKRIPYYKGINKVFNGFISITSQINQNEIIKNNKKATIFSLYGDYWGYDISLFNKMLNEEIILEPEINFEVINAVPPSKNIINIRCKIKKSSFVLEKIIKPDGIKIIYNLDNYNIKNKNIELIRLFGSEFIETNKKICKFIYERMELDLQYYFDISFLKEKKEKKLEIILKGIDKVTNMKGMFSNCNFLSSLPDINKLNFSNVTDMSYMFNNCNNLILPDISKWDTSNVRNMSYMFSNCKHLLILPDISKWDTSEVIDMSFMFSGCKSLSILPDISKWNISNVRYMNNMFCHCDSLSFLPDISKWNLENIQTDDIFLCCYSLINYPNNFHRKFRKDKENTKRYFTYCLNALYEEKNK